MRPRRRSEGDQTEEELAGKYLTHAAQIWRLTRDASQDRPLLPFFAVRMLMIIKNRLMVC